jgi:hypothetical protein
MLFGKMIDSGIPVKLNTRMNKSVHLSRLTFFESSGGCDAERVCLGNGGGMAKFMDIVLIN